MNAATRHRRRSALSVVLAVVLGAAVGVASLFAVAAVAGGEAAPTAGAEEVQVLDYGTR